jgi:hypothetical protein
MYGTCEIEVVGGCRERIELGPHPQQRVLEDSAERVQLSEVLSNLIGFVPLAGPCLNFGAELLQPLAGLVDP